MNLESSFFNAGGSGTMQRVLRAFFITLIFPVHLIAQHPGFEIIYEPTSQAGVALTPFGENEFLIFGGMAPGIGQNILVVRKIDSIGTELWVSYINGGGVSLARSILINNVGNPLIAGESNESNTIPNQYEAFIAELNENGEQLWRKYYGGDQGQSTFRSIVKSNDSGYLAVGGSSAFNGGNALDVYIVKTDSLGDTLWTKTWGTSNLLQYATQVVKHPQGGYALTGRSTSLQTGMDMFLMRISEDGEILWVETYDFNGNEMAFSLAITSDLQYVLGGYSYETITPPFQPTDKCIARINQEGELLWFKRFGGSLGDRIHHILLDEEDNVYATGKANSYSSGPAPAGYLMKMNADGDSLWCRVFFNETTVELWEMIRTSDNGFMIAGATMARTYVIRTDEWGCSVEGCHIETSVAQVHPTSCTMKLFPNPVHQALNVSFGDVCRDGPIEISIYSIQGQPVLQRSSNLSGEGLLTLDVSGLSAGMYVVQIQKGDERVVDRFVKR